jgi:MoxR-like ATPase
VRPALASNISHGEAPIPGDWLTKVVTLVRRTRVHPDLRVGSSVRGAIDCSLVATALSDLRGQPVGQPSVGLDAALVALSGRVRLREGSVRTTEEIVTELWQEVFGRSEPGADQGKAGAPTGATNSP